MAPLAVEEFFVGEPDGIFTLAFRGSGGDEALVFQLARRFDAQR